MVSVSEQKLDKILNAIAMLTEKVDKLSMKFKAIKVRLNSIESNLNNESKHIDTKAEKKELEQIRNEQLGILDKAKRYQQTAAIMNESYDKRFTILIQVLRKARIMLGRNQSKLWHIFMNL